MKKLRLLLLSFRLSTLSFYMAVAAPPIATNKDIVFGPNHTFTPSEPLKGSNPIHRYHVPGSQIALDFHQILPRIPSEDVLMCLVEGLAQIFGRDPSELIDRRRDFFYKHLAFVHVQDFDPTPGREHTYQDIADTLRGIGEYMAYTNRYLTSVVQIWAVTRTGDVKVGTAGVGGPPHSEGGAGGDGRLPVSAGTGNLEVDTT